MHQHWQCHHLVNVRCLPSRRQMSAAIMQKHGLKPSKQSAAELAAADDGSGSEVSGSGDGEEGSAGSSSDEDAADNDSDEAESDDMADAARAQADDADRQKSGHAAGRSAAAKTSDDEGSSEEEEEVESDGEGVAVALDARRQSGREASTAAGLQQPKRQVIIAHNWNPGVQQVVLDASLLPWRCCCLV